MANRDHILLWAKYPRTHLLFTTPFILPVVIGFVVCVVGLMDHTLGTGYFNLAICGKIWLGSIPFVLIWLVLYFVLIVPVIRKRFISSRHSVPDYDFQSAIETYQLRTTRNESNSVMTGGQDAAGQRIQYIPGHVALIPPDFILAGRIALAELLSIDPMLIHAEDDCRTLDGLAHFPDANSFVEKLLFHLGMTDKILIKQYQQQFAQHIARQVQTVPDLLIESWYLFNQQFPGMFAGR